MTKEQRTALMSNWWPSACRVAGWDPKDRDLRLKVLSEAVGRPLASASDLDHLTDIDRVKAHLLAISRPNDLAAQLRQANQPAIRAQYTIDQLKTKIAAVSPGNNYLRVVMQDKFGTTNWDDLTQTQFIQLYATLRNRRKTKSSSSSFSSSSSNSAAVAPEMTPQEVVNEISADPF